MGLQRRLGPEEVLPLSTHSLSPAAGDLTTWLSLLSASVSLPTGVFIWLSKRGKDSCL